MIQYFLAHLIMCIIVGLLGRERILGFWGYFLLSLPVPLLGPFIVAAVLIFTRPSKKY